MYLKQYLLLILVVLFFIVIAHEGVSAKKLDDFEDIDDELDDLDDDLMEFDSTETFEEDDIQESFDDEHSNILDYMQEDTDTLNTESNEAQSSSDRQSDVLESSVASSKSEKRGLADIKKSLEKQNIPAPLPDSHFVLANVEAAAPTSVNAAAPNALLQDDLAVDKTPNTLVLALGASFASLMVVAIIIASVMVWNKNKKILNTKEALAMHMKHPKRFQKPLLQTHEKDDSDIATNKENTNEVVHLNM
ncbi:hypothetical protein AKO1_002727 [Acrasis kona]|uniref:Uncharacterized protein n=1 Tax=Acrasis kona TaxID=1008807 RepID=A0AAW2YWE1_9EUKA